MASADPIMEFQDAAERARSRGVDTVPAALATVGSDGRPSLRIILVRHVDDRGFVFHTNYNSRKGRELEACPFASANFFWPELERQVNISGGVIRVSAEESDEYFQSRPFTSRVGAWASDQSEKIRSKAIVMTKAAKLMVKYAGGNVPRPPHWGGYRIVPDRFEFWQGRPSRLHDRIVYELIDGEWKVSRLSP